MKKIIVSALAIMLLIGLSGCGDETPEKSPIRIEAKTLSSDWGGYIEDTGVWRVMNNTYFTSHALYPAIDKNKKSVEINLYMS